MNHDQEQTKYWNSVVAKIAATKMTPSALAEINNFFNFLGINHDSKLKILDVGCGVGRLTIPLLEQGHEVTGTEIAEQNLTELAQICEKNHLNEHLALLCHDFETEPLEERFDFAICCNVIHHFDPEKKIAILTNIIKSLKPGGQLGIIEPNPFCLTYFLWYFLKEISGQDKGRWKVEKEFIHSTPGKLCKLLKELGLEEIKFRYYAFVPSRITNWSRQIIRLNNALSQTPLLRSLSAFTWFRARKNDLSN